MLRYTLSWLAAVALGSSIVSAAPVLQYTFDEASGPALDTGDAPPADGALVGAVRSGNTPSGAGSSIDLTDDASTYNYVLGSDAAKLDGLSAFTLTTWLNVSTYTAGNNRLVAKQNAGTFGGFNWGMNATPNDGTVGPDNFRLGLFIGNNVSSGATDFAAGFSTADVDAASKWVFLAVTYDGTQASDNTHFYIGGLDSPVAQLGSALSLLQLTVDGGDAPFGVGYTHAAPTADTSVIGLQDDVRVYNSALGATELNDIRLANVPEPASLGALSIGAAALLARRRHRRA